ncbi:MAG: hypothetical protein NVSMB4_12890 [Acidimicrobiales bacterium]
MADRSYLSIGQVLDLLKREFPDLTISKIRFLESQGLLDPERTPSGYRKFYGADIERLRFILREQSEHYLPLKVIKGRLGMDPDAEPVPHPGPDADLADEDVTVTAGPGLGAPVQTRPAAAEPVRGTWPRPIPAGRPAAPTMRRPQPLAPQPEPDPREADHSRERQHGDRPSPDQPLQDRQVEDQQSQARQPQARQPQVRQSQVRQSQDGRTPDPSPPGQRPPDQEHIDDDPDDPVSVTLDELAAKSGLSVAQVTELERFGLIAGRKIVGTTYYDADSLEIANLAATFRAFGVEARHLRMYRTAVEREAGFFEQVITPMLKQRNPQARRQATDTLVELSRLGQAMRAAMVRQALREYTGPS